MLSAYHRERCAQRADRTLSYIEEAISAVSAAKECLRLAHSLDGLPLPPDSVAILKHLHAALISSYTRLWVDLNQWPVKVAEGELSGSGERR